MAAIDVETACAHLQRRDPVMRRLIHQVGPFTLRPQPDRFGMLVRSIISQQISVAAARSIRRRLDELIAPDTLTPEVLLELSPAELRTAGLSLQKAKYLHDLALKVNTGQIQLRTIGRHSDEMIIQQLIQVKGIGRWTAQMFLIFALGRPDIFPEDDLGVRSAIRQLYELADLPDQLTCRQIAQPWRPYASVASWYCWRSLELPKLPSR